MSLRSQWKKKVEELYCSASDDDIPLEDAHLPHLSLTAEAFLNEHKKSQWVGIALPPLTCKDRYQYAIVFVEEGTIQYRDARSIDYPKSSGERLGGDFGEPLVLHMNEAIQYAERHWGGILLDPIWQKVLIDVVSEQKYFIVHHMRGIYVTKSQCEGFEMCWKKKLEHTSELGRGSEPN